MAIDDPVIARIVDSARCSFFDFVAKREARYPTLLERMAADPFFATSLLKPLGWFSIKQRRIRNRKFVFLSDRFPDLLDATSKDGAVIIGSMQERRRARKLGIEFCFNLDLYLAAHAVLFGARGIPVNRIIQRWISFLRQQASPCYVILPHDTSPISLLLTRISAECPNVKSVCIQHGLFNSGWDQDDIEGRNSLINLVYDNFQKSEMLRRLPTAIVEVLGLPAEVSASKPPSEVLPSVILVGTGRIEEPDLFQKSIAIYRCVVAALGNDIASVAYRPHPAEIRALPGSDYGFHLNVEAKVDLLSGPRRVFIGFTSTLLYEASVAGHAVIVLSHAGLPGYTICPIGVTIDCSELEKLPLVISEIWRANETCGKGVGGLRIRLLSALDSAERANFERSCASQVSD